MRFRFAVAALVTLSAACSEGTPVSGESDRAPIEDAPIVDAPEGVSIEDAPIVDASERGPIYDPYGADSPIVVLDPVVREHPDPAAESSPR